MTSAPQST